MRIVTVIAIIVILSVVYIPIPFVIKKIIRNKFLAEINKTDNYYLTFDDGPDIRSTVKILELLDNAGIKATFFLSGKNIEKHPEIVDTMVANGHAIGEHGYNHLHPWKCIPTRYISELIKSSRLMNKYIPHDKRVLYRPPFGKFNLITLLYIWVTNKKVVFWSIDPKDYQQQSGETVANIVLESLHPGSVILMHDGRIKQNGSSPEVTINALKKILESTKENASKFTTLSVINK